jgi:hypothetical protein
VVDYQADGTVKVTDASGGILIYHFDEVLGARRLVRVEDGNCNGCGDATVISHDANGYHDHVTDFNGNTTDYDYNDRGLEVKRTEALGTAAERTIRTQWHATFRLPVCRMTPGRTTVMDQR